MAEQQAQTRFCSGDCDVKEEAYINPGTVINGQKKYFHIFLLIQTLMKCHKMVTYIFHSYYVEEKSPNQVK